MDANALPPLAASISPLHAVAAPSDAARTLTVLAEYRLSEAGRKASLLNGGDGRAEQRVKMTVPSTRLHLVHVDGNGVARLKLRPQFKLNADQRIVRIKLAPVYDHPPTLDELLQDAARNHELERTYHAQRTTSQTTQRETYDEWRNQMALEFLGDPSQRAVVHPAPTPRRCQIVTERGRRALRRQARRGRRPKQVPLEAFRRFEQMCASGTARGAERRAHDVAVHAEKQQMMRDWVAGARLHGSARAVRRRCLPVRRVPGRVDRRDVSPAGAPCAAIATDGAHAVAGAPPPAGRPMPNAVVAPSRTDGVDASALDGDPGRNGRRHRRFTARSATRTCSCASASSRWTRDRQMRRSSSS